MSFEVVSPRTGVVGPFGSRFSSSSGMMPANGLLAFFGVLLLQKSTNRAGRGVRGFVLFSRLAEVDLNIPEKTGPVRRLAVEAEAGALDSLSLGLRLVRLPCGVVERTFSQGRGSFSAV